MPPPRLKRSNTAGSVPASLEDGEIAINQGDGKLYYHTAAGGVSTFLSVPTTHKANHAIGGSDALSAADIGALTQTVADGRYVNVTGDTMSGGLTINAATPLTVTGGRTFLAAASELYGVGVKYVSSGGAVYFGATDGTATPGAQISSAGGGALMSWTNAGAASIPGTLTVGGTLSATGVIATSLGSVSAPALTFTGDTNTGVYSPGADQWAVTTGGVQRLNISAAGDVGIGGTASSNVRLYNYHTVTNFNGSVCLSAMADPLTTATGSYAAFCGSFALRTDIAEGVTNTGAFRGLLVSALRNYKTVSGTDAGTATYLRGAEIQYGHAAQNTALTPATTQVVGLFLAPYNGHGAVGVMYDLLISSDTYSLGAITDHYAIYQQSTTAKNYFAGQVGIGTTSPALSSGVGVHIGGSTMRLAQSRTPATSTATGNTGEICWDSSYMYVCVATNTWRRTLHSTW